MTAVEKLIDQLTSIGVLEIPQGSNVVTYIIKQAKEMEEEQTINAVLYGFREDSDGDDWEGDNYNAEKYMKENFKSE